MADNTNLVTRTLFPSEILPLTVVLAGVVNHLIGFVILLTILLVTAGKVSPFIFLVPVYFACLLLFTLGLAWLVSSLNVFVRDTSQILGVVLTFCLVYPIFFSADRIHKVSSLVSWSAAVRPVIATAPARARPISGLGSIPYRYVFIAGVIFFRQTKREFVDALMPAVEVRNL